MGRGRGVIGVLLFQESCGWGRVVEREVMELEKLFAAQQLGTQKRLN